MKISIFPKKAGVPTYFLASFFLFGFLLLIADFLSLRSTNEQSKRFHTCENINAKADAREIETLCNSNEYCVYVPKNKSIERFCVLKVFKDAVLEKKLKDLHQ